MYDYKNELKHLSSENPDGLHKALLTVSLRAMRLCADAGTVRMDKLMKAWANLNLGRDLAAILGA